MIIDIYELQLQKSLFKIVHSQNLTSVADVCAPPPVEFALQSGETVRVPVAVSLSLHACSVAHAVGVGKGQKERKDD